MKLTQAQRETLRDATAHAGKVNGWTRRPTIQILSSAGLIEQRENLTGAARIERAAERDQWIGRAKELLAEDSWQAARSALSFASDAQSDLDSVSWFITDAGTAAIKP